MTTELLGQERSPVRDVTPPGVSRVYQTAPSVPIVPVGPTVPTEQFKHVRIQNDGSIWADGRILKLKAVTFPARNKICGEPNTVRWGCGNRAFGAAWLALEHKTFECEKLTGEVTPRVPIQVMCWADRNDLALMLLERGWVYLADSDPQSYVAAADAAKTNRLGLWADGPPEDTQKQKPKRPLAIP